MSIPCSLPYPSQASEMTHCSLGIWDRGIGGRVKGMNDFPPNDDGDSC